MGLPFPDSDALSNLEYGSPCIAVKTCFIDEVNKKILKGTGFITYNFELLPKEPFHNGILFDFIPFVTNKRIGIGNRLNLIRANRTIPFDQGLTILIGPFLWLKIVNPMLNCIVPFAFNSSIKFNYHTLKATLGRFTGHRTEQ